MDYLLQAKFKLNSNAIPFYRPGQIQVIAGEHNIIDDGEGTEQFINVTDVKQHEDYNGPGSSGNDVCIITLNGTLEFNE